MTKRAFVTGITGQDGSYLAELLLSKGYIVHGLVRRSSSSNLGRIDHLCKDESLKERFFLHWGDLADKSSLQNAIEVARPDEIYNLGAMSHVKVSFEMPEYTADVDTLGTLRLLEIVRTVNPGIRFYQASTSELFGKVQSIPQTESTPFYPCSPYGVSKLYGYWSVVNYREAYDLFACNGILFNHESERRGDIFVSKKITQSVARIKLGLQHKITLGNLDAKRDWGYAPDFVEGMWRMLQAEVAADYVLATGKAHSVREFVERSFKEVGITIEWQGEGLEEKGIDAKTGTVIVDISAEYFRPREVDFLLGDPTKAKKELGWNPQTTLAELVSIMVQYDLKEQGRNLVEV